MCLFTQSCPTLYDPLDCSLPGSSGHGISQARILEWVAIFFLQGIFPTQGSNQCLLCLLHCRQILHPLSHQESHALSKDFILELEKAYWVVQTRTQVQNSQVINDLIADLASGEAGTPVQIFFLWDQLFPWVYESYYFPFTQGRAVKRAVGSVQGTQPCSTACAQQPAKAAN